MNSNIPAPEYMPDGKGNMVIVDTPPRMTMIKIPVVMHTMPPGLLDELNDKIAELQSEKASLQTQVKNLQEALKEAQIQLAEFAQVI